MRSTRAEFDVDCEFADDAFDKLDAAYPDTASCGTDPW